MSSTKQYCQWGRGPVSKLLSKKWLLKKIEWVNYYSKHGCSFCYGKNHVETGVGDTSKECCQSCKAEGKIFWENSKAKWNWTKKTEFSFSNSSSGQRWR